MTFNWNDWEREVRRPILLTVVILLLLSILGSEPIKVSIKSVTGDWCIRAAKNGRSVTIEKCYWKQSANVTKVLKADQTFDIHPAIDDEDEDAGSINQPVPFLIRLIRKQQSLAKGSPSNVPTSCLSSISSTLTVEKCHLRKSRFRLTPNFPRRLQQAKYCSSLEMEQAYESSKDIRYSVHSSSQSCLNHIAQNSGGGDRNGSRKSFTHSLAFSKCVGRDDQLRLDESPAMMHQLWQFCTLNGNCSRSLLDMNWSSLIKTGFPTAEPDPVNCEKEEELTTIRTTTMDTGPSNGSTTPSSLNTTENININLWKNETFMLTEASTGSGSVSSSTILVTAISIISSLFGATTELITIIVSIYSCR